MAVGVDAEMRMDVRQIDDMKLAADVGFGSFDATVTILKQREFRKLALIEAATRLGRLMAERLEDAEGWHDTSRIEPARKSLGGRWA